MKEAITSEQQLLALLHHEEIENLEFKTAANNFKSEELFRYCVALANEGGGHLVLGVTNRPPREVVGTACFRDLNHIKKRILDTLHFRVDVHEIFAGDRRVVTFCCPARPIGMPHHYQGQYLMRSGESLVPMTTEVLQRIAAEGSPDFSQEPCNRATTADLSEAAIEAFRAQWIRKSGNRALTQSTHLQLLRDAHLLDGDHVTYAALVLLAESKSLARLLPQAELIFEYRTSDASIEHQERVEYRAGFFLWANALWDKINARNERHSYRDGLFRYEVPAFNEDVVREALLNAVTHRDYRDGGSIFVRQYPNRLEIVSPGGFPAGITEENIVHRQHPRNRRISEALQFCGLVERSGQGADRMFQLCIQEGKNRPSYTGSDATRVFLTLDGQIRDPRFVQYIDRLARDRSMSLAIDDFLVLDLVSKGEPVPPSLRSRLQHLVEQGVVEKGGRGRGVRHILSRALYEHVGEAGTYTRRKGLDDRHNQELLLKHIADCGTTGATMAEFTQVLPTKSRAQIGGLLKRLREAGTIRVEGRTKAARWFLATNTNKGRTIEPD